ncbi:MAG TPA: tRNA lysidine(34) synthetase TilS [Verrucomicrobiales bacterium]|nr:tRNA lysidine(34) synthetase TilS [Verrucomicrobiales bacterium]HIL69090.1 tRNA lysidine(34) synthetase TilS [Verrucomicrobiota bacterium]
MSKRQSAHSDAGFLLNQVEENICGNSLLNVGEKVGIAVSGGVDSMVLLDLIHQLAPKYGWKPVMLHYNHHLRGDESDEDESFTKNIADEGRIHIEIGHGDVEKLSASLGISIEMAARKLRYEYFAKVADQLNFTKILLGHHRDDQVELFFLRIFRGTGAQGICGMSWQSDAPVPSQLKLVRPLLNIDKNDLVTYADQKHIPYRVDSSNSSEKIPRNKIREHLLPLIRNEYQPAINEHVTKLMDLLNSENETHSMICEDWLKSGIEAKKPFERLPVSLKRRVIKDNLLKNRIIPNYGMINQLLSCPDKFLQVNSNKRIRIDGETGHLIFRREEVGPFWDLQQKELNLDSSEKSFLCFNRLMIQWEIRDNNWDCSVNCLKPTEGVEYFDLAKAGSGLLLRHWVEGDRFQPIGASRPIRLKKLFNSLKIPVEKRHKLVVAETEDKDILWVEGVRISEKHKIGSTTEKILIWKWKPTDPMA